MTPAGLGRGFRKYNIQPLLGMQTHKFVHGLFTAKILRYSRIVNPKCPNIGMKISIVFEYFVFLCDTYQRKYSTIVRSKRGKSFISSKPTESKY